MKIFSNMWCYFFTNNIILVLIITLTTCNIFLISADWDTNCPKYCRCKWQSGRKFADCKGSLLTTVPNRLNSEVQHLDLSDNKITKLPNHIFKDVGLIFLHKIILSNCGIYEIDQDAFEGLTILIELYLSDNYIHYLHPNTFQHLPKLRQLYLSNNSLEIIDEAIFSNLKYLQKIDLSHNNITSVSEHAFRHCPKLQTIDLKENKLKHMKPLLLDYTKPEEKLTSLVLYGNLWKCDCHLKAFRNWTIENNLYTTPTSCKEPNYLRGSYWNNVSADKFACKPIILEPDLGTTITLTSDNEKTISCKVYGDPIPAVNWKLNNKIIENDPRIKHTSDRHFIIEENGYDHYRWVNLTIRNPRSQDRGELICTAKNPGGIDERNVTVLLAPGLLSGLDGESNPVLLPLILGIIIGVFVLCIILIFLFYCLWQKRKLPSKNDTNTNGGANLDDTEMEKSLITAVNPVTKPPRRCDAPPSVASCGTEMSDLNRTLLDSDSVFNTTNGADEENRSLESLNPNLKQIKEMPIMDIKRSDRPYPPDLLSFSARASQVSPAGSCASTIPDYSRPPALHGPQSPIHSPIYGTLPSNLFRTLPYSRSHSPFTSPVGIPIVQSRQGYVTIPRRPRVPSWSAPSSALSPEVADPVYDNLGLRTTADGSSVLSLNKSVVETNPMRGRPLPATPSYQQNGLPMYYTPIEEHESPPAPCPTPRAPSVRGGSLQRLPTSPPPESSNNIRDSWASRTGPEGASLGMLISNEDSLSGSVSPTPSSVSGTLGRSPKVPPKPPPKPKKKTVVSGPLFEDEGEDGTEV